MGNVIHLSKIKQTDPVYRVPTGLIQEGSENCGCRTAEEHDSKPIKELEDIAKISNYFIAKGKWRDNMLFITGINMGLRVSDLLTLRFGDLIDENMNFRSSFAILEKKTSNTRKVKRNRYVGVNQAVRDAVILYLEHTDNVSLDSYMFPSESKNGSSLNKPIHRNSVERILKDAAKAVGISEHVATHTLRKTFGYHQMMMSGNDPRKLLLLQKIFGHSSATQTLTYIGITNEEIEEAYLNLNLGGSKVYEKNHYISA